LDALAIDDIHDVLGLAIPAEQRRALAPFAWGQVVDPLAHAILLADWADHITTLHWEYNITISRRLQYVQLLFASYSTTLQGIHYLNL